MGQQKGDTLPSLPNASNNFSTQASAETTPAATPPPPPSRQATAPPGKEAISTLGIANSNPGHFEDMGPPVRPASAIDMGSQHMKAPPRTRSNLVPRNGLDAMSAPPSPPMRPNTSTPPLGASVSRPKSTASKRNVRSRYVDVFQQPSDSQG